MERKKSLLVSLIGIRHVESLSFMDSAETILDTKTEATLLRIVCMHWISETTEACLQNLTIYTFSQ